MSKELNPKKQFYKGIELRIIHRSYRRHKAKRFTLNGTNQNVWIPNKHLKHDGTLKLDENIDYVFRQSTRQLELAGYTEPIVGIKRRTAVAQ